MWDIADERRSYRCKSRLPFGLPRRRDDGLVAAPFRCPASTASPIRALARWRSQRGPQDFCHLLLANLGNPKWKSRLTLLYPFKWQYPPQIREDLIVWNWCPL